VRPLGIALFLAASALVSLACGQDEEVIPPAPRASSDPAVQPTAAPTTAVTPAVKGQLWRWVNVTVVIPEGSEVHPVRDLLRP